MDLHFLRDITFAQAELWFEAVDGVLELPPFAGSALRGVFGHAFRAGLCENRPACEQECRRPASCGYYLVFERERSASTGANAAKPYILDPPVPVALERIAGGGEVASPYQVRAFAGVPHLENETPTRIPEGGQFPVRFTLLGQTIPVLPRVVELLARAELQIGRGRFRLVRALDTAASRRVLFDRSLHGGGVQAPTVQNFCGEKHNGGKRLQLSFVTPARLRREDEYTFDCHGFANHFWQAALVRAMRVRDDFCAPGGVRVPWQELPAVLPRVGGARFFRYRLERLSNRQERRMEFDGLVGSVEYEGDFGEVWPLVAAAEILHIGQKATFGLGRVSAFWGE